MECDELVLSDVHLGQNTELLEAQCDELRLARSRFLYKETFQSSSDASEIKRDLVDEDGDLNPVRKEEANYGAVFIDHCLATRFEDVGMQVWSSCLLLCDFILDQPELFWLKNVLELGAGVGLVGLVCSKFSKNIICTDCSVEALKLCERNFLINSQNPSYCGKARVKHLDWSEDISSLNWPEEDLKLLKSIEIILASDVIFSDALTDSFVNSLLNIVKGSDNEHIEIYIALEKRLNFTLEARDVACPAYTHFMHLMHELCCNNKETDHSFNFSQITNVGQHFIYERSKYLELWKLKATKSHSKLNQGISK